MGRVHTSVCILLLSCCPYWLLYSDGRHNERDGVSNHRCLDCFLRHKSKKISKLRVTGLCEGNPPVTGRLPPQRASNAEDVSIWWRHQSIRRHSGVAVTQGRELLIGIHQLTSSPLFPHEAWQNFTPQHAICFLCQKPHIICLVICKLTVIFSTKWVGT